MKVIKLDIDEKIIDWDRIRAVVQVFKLKIDFDSSKICKTKNGFHLYLEVLNNFNDKELCFYQLAMGSDAKREMLNWKRITSGSEWERREWNVLFCNKFHVGLDGKRKLVSKEVELDKNILVRNLHDI